MNIKFPIQPIKNNRFIPNRIVKKLLDVSTLDMNSIAQLDFTNEEREQFAQLIGYSLSSFSELSYVSDETDRILNKINLGFKNEDKLRIEDLTNTLNKVKALMKDIVPILFEIHPDDLGE